MKPLLLSLSRTFLTGLLAMLPLAATLLICAWCIGVLLKWLGPDSWLGYGLSRLGIKVGDSVLVGYVLGFGIFVAVVLILGWLVELNLQRGLAGLLDSLMHRIPLVRNLYDVLQKLTQLFTHRGTDKARSLQPVWCHFGGIGGSVALGLLSAREPFVIGEDHYYAVLIPTAPVPVGGGLLYLPEAWVVPADLGIDAVTSIYVSMGVTSGQYLPVKSAAERASVLAGDVNHG
jgi:uncharacterized membrane protein